LELDRHYIERNDFSAARRGYDPDEVDRHLRELADAVAELKRQQKPSPASLATAAADQVRSIVEAAEKSAADIQSQAEQEARRITEDASQRARETREKADSDAVERVRRAEESTEKVLERANGVEGEIDRLLSDLRSSANQLMDSLRSAGNGLVENLNGASSTLRTEFDAVRAEFSAVREARLEPDPGGGAAPAEPEVAGPPDAEPGVVAGVAGVEAEAAAAPVQEDVAASEVVSEQDTFVEGTAEEIQAEPQPEVHAPPEHAPPAAEDRQAEPAAPAQQGGRSIRGAEGARLIALNMALNGTPRDETARYLEQNFELDDQDALLDEVYARVGG